jgi:hypothetical protein
MPKNPLASRSGRPAREEIARSEVWIRLWRERLQVHVSQAQSGLSPFVEQLEAHDRIAGMAAVFPTVRDLSSGDDISPAF